MHRLALALVLTSAVSWGHDVSADVSGSLTTTSADNPRAGSFGVAAAGSWDVSDAWSVGGLAVYTRDLPTRTAESSSPGSDVFLLSLGVTWLPADTLMTMLTVTGSPPAAQANATTVRLPGGRAADLVVASRTWTLGATWNGLWLPGGSGAWEHALDVTLGFNHVATDQRLELPSTPGAALLRQACLEGRPLAVCPLLSGVSTPLWQGRFGVGYTATLARNTDLALDATYFLYDQPPSAVGYFSVVSAGRELGNGVPVLPLQLSVRPSVAQRLGPVTLKLGYQYGLYTEGLGALHAATLKASVKVTRAWRLSLTVTGQVDAKGGVLDNPGGQALLGVLCQW